MISRDDSLLIARLYEAGLDRNGRIDEGGLNYWIDAFEGGLPLVQMARLFLRSAEFTEAFGAIDTLTDAQFVDRLYQNVLGRTGDDGGVAFWNRLLDSGTDRGAVLLEFARSGENVANTPFVEAIVEISEGRWYYPTDNRTPAARPVAEDAEFDGGPVVGRFDGRDPDGDGLTYSVLTRPRDADGNPVGTVTVLDGGRFVFEPADDFTLAPGETAVASFTYRATDDSGTGNAMSTPGRYTVTLTGVDAVENAAPVAPDATLEVAGDAERTELRLAATDADGDALRYEIVEDVIGVEGLLLMPDGVVIFETLDQFDDLPEGETRTFTLTYRAVDARGAASEPATLTLVVAGTAEVLDTVPTAADVTAELVDGTVFVSGAFAGADADGDALAYEILGETETPYGRIEARGDGTFRFTPTAAVATLGEGVTETLRFDYVATDEDGNTSAPASITLDLIGTNTAPEAADRTLVAMEDQGLSNFFTTPEGNVFAGGRFSLLADASDADGDDLAFSVTRQPVLGRVEIDGEGRLWFDPEGAFEHLNEGERGEVTLEYAVSDPFGAESTAEVTILVDGANDAPTAATGDISLELGEDDGPITFRIDIADVDDDLGDLAVSFAQPSSIGFDPETGGSRITEFEGLSYNGDGTFTFDPGTQFQGLAEGETQFTSTTIEVGDGQETTQLTVGLIVHGADETRFTDTARLTFETGNRSMFEDGPAVVLEPDLSDFGVSFTFDETFSRTILPTQTFLGTTTPSVRFDGSVEGEIGIDPFFSLTSGEIDAQVPVDVTFTAPEQVAPGETFTFTTAYAIGDAARFQTASPGVEFGLNLIFDVAAEASLTFGDSSFGPGFTEALFPAIDIDARPEIFRVSTEDNLEVSIDLPLDSSLTLNAPEIETVGTPSDRVSDRLTSRGEDDVAVLEFDIDAVVTKLLQTAAVPAPPFGYTFSKGLAVGPANLLGVEADIQVLDVDLVNTLTAIQNFRMDIEDLPLALTVEGLAEPITGLSLGDEISVTAPDTDTNGDGRIDFDFDVDMSAVMRHVAGLGFSSELVAGIFRLTGGISSDFFDGPGFSLFENGTEELDDDFLVGASVDLFAFEDFPPLFDETFGLSGFEDNPQTDDSFGGSLLFV